MKKRNSRKVEFDDEGLKAINLLKRNGESISKAVCRISSDRLKDTLSTTPVEFKTLDPQSYLMVQTDLLAIESKIKKLKTDLLKIKPTDREVSQKMASLIESIQEEIKQYQLARLKLGRVVKLVEPFTVEEYKTLQSLTRLVNNRLSNPELVKFKAEYELELKILQSLI